MACGCKNKGNQSQPAPQQAQVQQVQQVQQTSSSQPVVNESIKDTIKKTIEKYYNVNKTTK